MPANITAITYFAPISVFLIVFIISYAIFAKTKLLGENKWLNLFTSFLIASIFISAAGAREYVQTLIPWVAVLLVSLVFILIMTGLIGKHGESMTKGIGALFLALFGLVFLISALFVFSHIFIGILPGPGFGLGIEPKTFFFLTWLYSPPVLGAILLILTSAIVSWILVKSK